MKMMKPNIVILLCGLSRAVVAVNKKRGFYHGVCRIKVSPVMPGRVILELSGETDKSRDLAYKLAKNAIKRK